MVPPVTDLFFIHSNAALLKIDAPDSIVTSLITI